MDFCDAEKTLDKFGLSDDCKKYADSLTAIIPYPASELLRYKKRCLNAKIAKIDQDLIKRIKSKGSCCTVKNLCISIYYSNFLDRCETCSFYLQNIYPALQQIKVLEDAAQCYEQEARKDNTLR